VEEENQGEWQAQVHLEKAIKWKTEGA